MTYEETRDVLRILKAVKSKINHGWVQDCFFELVENRRYSYTLRNWEKVTKKNYSLTGAIDDAVWDVLSLDCETSYGERIIEFVEQLVAETISNSNGKYDFKGNYPKDIIKSFNDMPYRTKETVCIVLEKTIYKVEKLW